MTPDEIKLGCNDLGNGSYLCVSQDLLDDIKSGKFKSKDHEKTIEPDKPKHSLWTLPAYLIKVIVTAFREKL